MPLNKNHNWTEEKFLSTLVRLLLRERHNFNLLLLKRKGKSLLIR